MPWKEEGQMDNGVILYSYKHFSKVYHRTASIENMFKHWFGRVIRMFFLSTMFTTIAIFTKEANNNNIRRV